MKNATRVMAILLALLMALALIPFAAFATEGEVTGGEGAGGEGGGHSHEFSAQVATDDYLCSAATCTAPASYYYSCACGEKGTETFPYGEPLPHEFVNGVCTCGAADPNYTPASKAPLLGGTPDNGQDNGGDQGTALTGTVSVSPATATVGGTLTASVADSNNSGTLSYAWYRNDTAIEGASGESYQPVEADLGARISCKVSSDKETGTLSSNSALVVCAEGSHSFTAETVSADALKSAATCTAKAVYYKSCANCGLSAKGIDETQTFESGEALGHDWSQHDGVCAREGCGEVCTHTFNEQRTCTVCGYQRGEPVAVVSASPVTEDDQLGPAWYAATVAAFNNIYGEGKVKCRLYYVTPYYGGNVNDPVAAEDVPTDGLSFTLGLPEGVTEDDDWYVFVYHYNTDEPLGWEAEGNSLRVSSTEFSPFMVVAVPMTGELVITGEPVVGYTLTAEYLSDTDPLAYQWIRGETDIAGATTATYIPTADDAKKVITCKVKVADDQWVTAKGVTIIPLPAPKKEKDVVDDGASQRGVISGVTAEMEYIKSNTKPSTDTGWTALTGESFEVTSGGTYWVRVQGLNDTAKSVVVDDYYTVTTKLLYGKGTITPTTSWVKAGELGPKFTLTPSKNYKVADIRVDGTSVDKSEIGTTYQLGRVYAKTEVGYGFMYTGSSPKTGDDSHLALWTELAALSMLGLFVTARALRKRKEN